MLFSVILLESKLFLLFFRLLGLSLPGLSTDFRPFVRLPLGLVFSVISTVPILNVRNYCRLEVRKVAMVFLRNLLVPPFVVNL
jgi:hypothetical protein